MSLNVLTGNGMQSEQNLHSCFKINYYILNWHLGCAVRPSFLAFVFNNRNTLHLLLLPCF